jgi:hypothetical protein
MDRKEWKSFLLGIYLIVMCVIFSFLLLALWYGKVESSTEPKQTDPKQADQEQTDPKQTDPEQTIWKARATVLGIMVQPQLRLILLVIVTGALGSYLHTATSFATYTGNRSFVESWYWWYVLRPFIGMVLALIFYFALRGGFLLLTADRNVVNISPFGVGALSGLVGMFSKQATDKLREMFDNLFKTGQGGGDEERTDKLEEMRPVTDLMLGANRITACELNNGRTEDNVTIKELYDLLKGVVTRIPVYDDKGAAKYVIHQSLLFKYISAMSVGTPGQPVDIATLKLKDFLGFGNMREIVEKSLGFVSKDATLRDAKKKMEEIEKCQDVFVTQNGEQCERVLGWLTNIEIMKHTRA